jgi:hypothetical protein
LPGLPDPFADPVRGSVCGLEARSVVGAFRYLPAPRRAVGPNLMALCVGAQGAIAQVEAASLPLVRIGARMPNANEAAPSALTEGEAAAWSAVVAAFHET